MINLSYQLSDKWNAKSSLIDFANADELTLRYKVFMGDQIIVINDADLSARWGWVPLLDFAACFYTIVEKLKSGESELIYEFTESDALLQFNQQGDKVLIAATYGNAKGTVLLSELEQASRTYLKNVLSGAINLHPALKANSSLKTWYPLIM